MESVPTLITVPARAENAQDIDVLLQTLVSLRTTAPEAMVLVVDDRSPEPLARLIEAAAAELDCIYVLQQDGEGRSAAVNVGLSVASAHQMDACIVASGLVLERAGWLERLRGRTGTVGAPAAVAGGAVVDGDGIIRQAGYFFSVYRRAWSARLNNVPQELLDVDQPVLCPVSAELQLIRRAWIDQVGLYDELLDGAHAALDFCLRVAETGGECVFEPTVRARALTDGDGEPDDTTPAGKRLRVKHTGVNFSKWAPEVI